MTGNGNSIDQHPTNVGSTTHHPPLTLNLIGWRLDEAKAALQSDPQTQHCSLRVIETAPPVRPPRIEKQRKRSGGEESGGKHRAPALHYGEWRVLSCQLIEPQDQTGIAEIELVVAREQVSDELAIAINATQTRP